MIFEYFRIYDEKIEAHYNLTRITGILLEDLCTFMEISRSFLLRIRNISPKVVEKIKTHILCPVTFSFFFGNRADYDIMWKNTVQCDRPQLTI